MGGRWELGARCRGCWGSSTSVRGQLRPGRVGVQAARGGVMGGVTHLGCTQWVLVVVVGGDGGGGESREWEETTDVARDRHIK